MNIEIGNYYKGTCVHIDCRGAVFELEDNSTAYVHISKIADCFIKNIGDFIEIGDTYQLECVESNVPGNRYEFSLIYLNLQNRYASRRHKTERRISRSLNKIEQPKNNLERMISDMNASYQDKRSLINKRNKRRK